MHEAPDWDEFMSRFFGLIAIAILTGPTRAGEPSVADLVKQLGDPKFARRETAQKELLRRGEGIVPELDRLTKTADPEAAERLRKIRYGLVGYKDEIRRLLADVHEGKDIAPVPVSDEMRGLIASHQPGAGNLLLAVLRDSNHKLYRRALRAFISAWDAATPDQIDSYLRQSVSLNTTHRPKFPAKVGALISFEAQLRDGWSGWPPIRGGKKFDFRMRTTCYLDGKPYENPFEDSYPFATVGTYRVGELPEGEHTIHAVMEYEFTQGGQKRKGEIRSNESSFEVLPADTPDDLIAAPSTSLTAKVHKAFVIHENRRRAMEAAFRMPAVPDSDDEWRSQVRWQAPGGKWFNLSCPSWKLAESLEVDLCFDVEIHDLKSAKAYPADPMVLRRGQTGRGYVIPRDPRLFAKGREGFVTVRVVMKPSRVVALSDQRITSYYPLAIHSADLRMKITPPNSVTPRSK